MAGMALGLTHNPGMTRGFSSSSQQHKTTCMQIYRPHIRPHVQLGHTGQLRASSQASSGFYPPISPADGTWGGYNPSNPSGSTTPPPPPSQDGLMGWLTTIWGWSRGLVDGCVNVCVNAFLMSSLAPATVSRVAVENSVRGAMALLGLGMLKSVLSLVLVVGLGVLIAYTATQVFGLRLPGRAGASKAGDGAAAGDVYGDARSSGESSRFPGQYTTWNGDSPDPFTSSSQQSSTTQDLGYDYVPPYGSRRPGASGYGPETGYGQPGTGRQYGRQDSSSTYRSNRSWGQDDVIDVFYDK